MNRSRSVQSWLARALSRGAFAISALICLSMFETPVFAQYKRADLVSNQAGAAPTQDAHLVNGWGLVASPQVHSGLAIMVPDFQLSILGLVSRFIFS
jgi:hypothetical protein